MRTTTRQAPLDPRAQALLPNAPEAQRRGLCCRYPIPAWHFTFAIWGMLGSLLNPARGILSCNVFTLDLAKEEK